jgi:uncharacterized protein (DUF952 family)
VTTAAYKIMTEDEFAQLRRDAVFHGAPVDLADGFIHLSSGSQLLETVERHFSGRDGLVIVAVDLAALGEAVRWEPSRGGQLFPHVYGPLPIGAVLASGPLERSADGALKLPG